MNTKSIEFSIILPCYNVTKYIEMCLDSVFANDTSGCEIILVDDGSKDAFRDCVQNYFQTKIEGDCCRFSYKDTAIVIISKKNSGVSSARNRGIRESTKEYLLFVDPDDTVSVHWLATIREHLRTTPSDICLFGFSTIYEGDSREHITLPQQDYCLNSNRQ